MTEFAGSNGVPHSFRHSKAEQGKAFGRMRVILQSLARLA